MAKNQATKTVKVLRVVSRPDTFRRAGRTFTKTPTDIPLADLSKEEIETLKGDASLVAYEAEAEVAAEGETAA